MKPLNLASRPLRNQKPWILLLVCVNLVLLVLTAVHVGLALRLHPSETAELRRELARLEQQISTLQAESRGLERQRPTEPKMAEWALLKDLVDARTFDWVELFARLGEGLPEGTRLVSVTPSMKKDVVALSLDAVARSPEAMFETVMMLETRPEFEGVYMENASANDEGVASRLELNYRPPPSADAASVHPTKAEGQS
jgi:Tfp pilus assembly protein PilN